jgi:SMC interacting uncharacterized protein involved in chromosome segregation
VKRLLIRLLAAFGLVPAGRYETLRRHAEALTISVQNSKVKGRETKERLARLSLDVETKAHEVKDLQRQVADLQVLLERLTVAELDLATARELLMAVDVKLDILEGAANVLDTRTRSVVSRQRSGASV